MSQIPVETFFAVDIRLGTITAAEPFPEARKPAYKLTIDFGPQIGLKRSSAQITEHYRPGDLVGRQVFGVVNLPPRRIGPFVSEVLVLGVSDGEGRITLARVDHAAPNGARMH
jgi:tRNA-binding protein